MGLRDWLVRRLSREAKFQVRPTRTIEDVKISVEWGLGGTRHIQVQAWDPDTTQGIFWSLWDGLDERER